MDLTGIHHLTAVSADIRGNYRFYTGTLGMRLVKRSVNQDDVSAYHLFYADAVGSPGTDLTFFDWKIPRERRGTRSVVRTHLLVDGGETLEWWSGRFAVIGVRAGVVRERDGRFTLDFEDPEGQRLSLVDHGGRGGRFVPWNRSPVPAEHQIQGLGPIVMSVPRIQDTDRVLSQVMGLRRVRQYPAPDNVADTIHVYEMGAGGPQAELHVAEQSDLGPARLGAGGVHHVAFRTPNEAEYHAWRERLDSNRIPNSGEVDRYYFRSLYFREPNGVLFEIATDGPGFAVDEDPATLGEYLALPPFLEPRRETIAAALEPIV
jgi:glyoxalase family protein